VAVVTTYVLRGLSYSNAEEVARRLRSDDVPARIDKPRTETRDPVMFVDADSLDVEQAVPAAAPSAIWFNTGT
jgi:hypothetical protein